MGHRDEAIEKRLYEIAKPKKLPEKKRVRITTEAEEPTYTRLKVIQVSNYLQNIKNKFKDL